MNGAFITRNLFPTYCVSQMIWGGNVFLDKVQQKRILVGQSYSHDPRALFNDMSNQ